MYARPISMGYIHSQNDLSPPKGYVAEAKYNGWGGGVRKRGMPESRHGRPFDDHIQELIAPSVKELRERIDWDFCDVVHCEFMVITPMACSKRVIIAHDCIGGFASECYYWDRTMLMWKSPEPPRYQHWAHFNNVFRPEIWRGDKDIANALEMQLDHNRESDELFYEGFVYKKPFAHYGAKNAWIKQRIQNQILTEGT